MKYNLDPLIDFKAMEAFCKRMNKKFPFYVECYHIFTESDVYLGKCTEVKISLLCKNSSSDKDAVKQFLASYILIPEIVKFFHRKKMQFINLRYEFEGEPEPRRIVCEIIFTVCRKE